MIEMLNRKREVIKPWGKEELELTISGHARLGMSTLRLSEGDTFHVTPGTIHRFSATLGTNVVLAEVSTNYLDDVVRLEDDYDRDC